MADFTQWLKIFQVLDENKKRWFAAEKAIDLGRGGIKLISELTGLSRTTIIKGISDLNESKTLPEDRVRKTGGGRKPLAIINKKIISEIEKIVDENTAGHPMNALKWTSKTSRNIADELARKGFEVSHTTVCKVLNDLEYSLQSNKKILSTKQDPERDEQFKYINKLVTQFSKNNDPVISVDTKKKELIGNFKNNGQTWKKKGQAQAVLDHDFRSLGKGIAIPYGAYDIQENEGFVNVGISSDTAEFAANSIYQWWKAFGCKRYPEAVKLLICADGGGSNGSRSRLWKKNIQELVNKILIPITVCHYPPGTSKWNKIEHRMFSFISLNWKGIPLENYETVINLIGGTKTKTGLKVKAKLDKNSYEKGLKVSEDDFEKINLTYHKKHPKWNYTIKVSEN
jgi:hypothetical protein